MSEEFLDSADHLEFLTDLEKEKSRNTTEGVARLDEGFGKQDSSIATTKERRKSVSKPKNIQIIFVL